ncbi:Gfo/Idh/MocA family protein [Paenibacillus sacheonensis]|uniref:Gfo/Idh/MocA family oxidoreductase n=1 Tax=Paenibacillus sacheonensis TaxID=742054 RepID=A0A7X4YSW8_9BACL|nr:Gfo/Idh/MocA family oxidoreductase [Paenibacillus sacheonensis]MBM7567767.1 putative dehydrogenase [Paenibacillus sacheonensis]NBC71962.1 Gfo/Idh/MocA family oxidoreductase [Paenibacillus sacheonensis]
MKEKLKLLQAGLGGHGGGVARHFVRCSEDFELVGLLDLNREALQAAGAEFGIPEERLYTDYRAAVTESGADALLLVVISPAHHEIAKYALQQGLHVLIEKPFTLSLADARELVELAEQQRRNIMINQNYRYVTAVLTLKQALSDASLGMPLFAQAHFFCNHDGKPYQRAMDNYALLEMSVHHVDMIRFLLDTDIVAVNGRTWNDPGSGYQGDPHVQAAYDTEAGVPVFYLSSLLAKGKADPWEGVWRFQFQRGTVHLADMGEGYGVYVTDEERQVRKLADAVNGKDSIHGVLAEFAASIRERREPAISGADNLRTLAALFATADSSREGRRIRLPAMRA